MSYEIIYGKQFIKVDEKRFIPMIFRGSSNCFSIGWNGRQKRERHWSIDTFFSNGSRFTTAEEILKGVDDYRNSLVERDKDRAEDEKYEDKRFGYYTAIKIVGKHGLTFNQFKSIYKTGIKQAMTVEELREHGIVVELYTYNYNEKAFTSRGLEIKPNKTALTSEELMDEFAKLSEYYGELSQMIGISLSADEDDLRKLSKKRSNRVKKEKVLHVVKEFWTLKMKNQSGYFIKSTKRHIKYSYSAGGGKNFIDEASCLKFHKKMRNAEHVEPVKIVREIAEMGIPIYV